MMFPLQMKIQRLRNRHVPFTNSAIPNDFTTFHLYTSPTESFYFLQLFLDGTNSISTKKHDASSYNASTDLLKQPMVEEDY
mmetsp:Transcript_7527/g.14274  ORF Transcript_7527/g.14274 Transcript_7527/m.14274 type:complete len:81 (-) Transcript_7527:589-831(-)